MAASRRQTHTDGMISLLRARGEGQFQTPRGTHLFTVLLSAMVRTTPELPFDYD